MSDYASSLEALSAALAPELQVIDHGRFAQIVRADGEHVCVVGFDPLAVEFELSVVLPVDREDEDTRLAWARVADDLLRADRTVPWIEAGFVVAEVGEVLDAEVVDDPDRRVWSYDVPVTTRAATVEQIREIVDWAWAREREYVLWGLDGPMSPLRPVDD